jgi:hypothetical protein
LLKSLVTLICVTSTSTSAALACDCVGYPSASSQLAEARIMVVARAEWTRRERGTKPDAELGVTRFTVVETIKGPRRAWWQIAHSVAGEASCGINFKPGRKYVVLIGDEQGRLATNWCRRIRFPLLDYKRAKIRTI